MIQGNCKGCVGTWWSRRVAPGGFGIHRLSRDRRPPDFTEFWGATLDSAPRKMAILEKYYDRPCLMFLGDDTIRSSSKENSHDDPSRWINANLRFLFSCQVRQVVMY